METVKLQPVDLWTYYWLCANYAVQRTGKYSVGHLVECAGDQFESWADVSIGDIVCWFVDERIYNDKAIELNGAILTSPCFSVSRHFGVYEGDNVVSDLTFDSQNKPIIRLRRFTHLREPRYVFRYNKG